MSTLCSNSTKEVHARLLNSMDPTATEDVGNKELEDVCLPKKGTNIGGGEDVSSGREACKSTYIEHE